MALPVNPTLPYITPSTHPELFADAPLTGQNSSTGVTAGVPLFSFTLHLVQCLMFAEGVNYK